MAASMGSQFGVILTLFLAQHAWRLCESQQPNRVYDPDTIGFTVREIVCGQPQFFNMITKNDETVLLDNICVTFFPLPEDPDTFTFYQSIVYCDGSNSVETFIIKQSAVGQARVSNPSYTYRYFNIGYIGCDTFLVYANRLYGDRSFLGLQNTFMFGFSNDCKPIGLSCLRKVEEQISTSLLPAVDFYVLPMKLPNRCITEQLCSLPPNPFYNNLNTVSLY